MSKLLPEHTHGLHVVVGEGGEEPLSGEGCGTTYWQNKRGDDDGRGVEKQQ